MDIPDEYELISIFESNPDFLDDKNTPFYYNTLTYKFTNQNNEKFIITISPAYNEFEISVYKNNDLKSNLLLHDVKSLVILSDNKVESKIMLTYEKSVFKILLKPEYKLFYNDEYL